MEEKQSQGVSKISQVARNTLISYLLCDDVCDLEEHLSVESESKRVMSPGDGRRLLTVWASSSAWKAKTKSVPNIKKKRGERANHSLNLIIMKSERRKYLLSALPYVREWKIDRCIFHLRE